MNTILITGATSGIGEAIARRYAHSGPCRLVLTGRRAERLTALAEELTAAGSQVYPLVFDVRAAGAVKAAIESLPAEWREIDILVNNAGLAVGTDPIQEATTEAWDMMLDTNVKGLLYVSHEIMPLMVAREKGHIVNIGSIAGKEVYPGGQVYCASKFAVNAISQAMRIDMLKYGIKVSHIAPGMVETEFSLVRFNGDTEKAKLPYKGLDVLSGTDIAEVVWWVTSLPAHLNINDITVMPTAQANTTQVFRK